MNTTATHQVLIVGGGTAGITVAARMLRKGDPLTLKGLVDDDVCKGALS